MEITIAGANGFIGSSLVRFMEERGHTVRRLARRGGDSPLQFKWDPEGGLIDPAAIDGAQAVINTAGANLATDRWTDARMREIRDSRVLGTETITRAIASSNRKPAVFVNTSAIGYYGTHPEGWVDESSPRGKGFLAGVCEDWELATKPAAEAGVRVVLLRLGVVIAPDAGVVAKLLPVFRLGIGGPIGDGGNWLSWISVGDLMRAYERVLVDSTLSGPVNAVSPNACTNKEFASELARALGKPAAVRTPAAAVRLMFGKMADETVLTSTRARPGRLLDAGFEFKDAAIGDALRALGGE